MRHGWNGSVMRTAVEISVHGRGGQGVVTAAELLSVAGFDDGLQAQAIPSFGSERMGAPVVAYCRLSPVAIRTREPVATPDAVLIIDSTLLHHVDVFAGLRPEGFVVLNSSRSPEDLGLADLVTRQGRGRVCVVPASEIAREHTGGSRPNVCLLGALVALTGMVSMAGLEHAVRARMSPDVAAVNLAAARAAHHAALQVVSGRA